MNADPDIPEPDRAPGAPHPRHTERLFGQDDAEAAFLDAFNAGRLHHGWLISGPRGVGKATLAWRIARFLLTQPPPGDAGLFGAPPAPASLDADPGHLALPRIAALADPGLWLVRIPWDEKLKKLKTEITVEEVRKLKNFFQLSSTDGGRRVVIVDAADDLNVNAANALLKLLEEPPANATFLLVAHQPSRLLPTIRSRCRELRCRNLSALELAEALHAAGIDDDAPASLATLAHGSAGQAIRLNELDGSKTYADLVALMATLPRLDRPSAIAMADKAGARNQPERFALIIDLIDLFLSRLARTGVTGPPATEICEGEAQLMARLCPDPASARHWAALQQSLGARARQGKAVNLDPSSLILDMILSINDAASKLAA